MPVSVVLYLIFVDRMTAKHEEDKESQVKCQHCRTYTGKGQWESEKFSRWACLPPGSVRSPRETSQRTRTQPGLWQAPLVCVHGLAADDTVFWRQPIRRQVLLARQLVVGQQCGRLVARQRHVDDQRRGGESPC